MRQDTYDTFTLRRSGWDATRQTRHSKKAKVFLRDIGKSRSRTLFLAKLLSVVVRSDTPGSQGQDGRTSTGISRCRIQGHRIVQDKTAEGRLAERPTEDFEVGFY